MQYTVIQKIHTFTYIHKNESKHSEMGPVRQNPIQRPVRSVNMCVHCTVHNCCTQYCSDRTDLIIFPLTLQTIREVGLGSGHIVLDGDPAPTAAPPHFRPMTIVAKRSPISATAELVLFVRGRQTATGEPPRLNSAAFLFTSVSVLTTKTWTSSHHSLCF